VYVAEMHGQQTLLAKVATDPIAAHTTSPLHQPLVASPSPLKIPIIAKKEVGLSTTSLKILLTP
jgi:hypothetical protein